MTTTQKITTLEQQQNRLLNDLNTFRFDHELLLQTLYTITDLSNEIRRLHFIAKRENTR